MSPVTAAGSGMPQCAVTGRPGQTGHASLAALSQTVKTKSSSGAPGPENSSQLLDLNPSVGKPSPRRRESACGFTVPFGQDPAENARNLSPPVLLRSASARIERAEFPVQRKSTL